MYEEDRQTAMAMYEKMFDDAEDEQALLHLLSSPTRQAVLIARAYNAKERKLAVHSQAGRGEADVSSSELPAFVEVINDIHDDAINLNVIAPEILKNQISFFGAEESVPVSEEAPINQAKVEEVPAAPVVREAPPAVTEEVSPAPAAYSAPEETDEPEEPVSHDDEIKNFLAGILPEGVEPAFPVSETGDPKSSEAPEEETGELSFDVEPENHDDRINDFIASFDVDEDSLTRPVKPAEPAESVPAQAPAEVFPRKAPSEPKSTKTNIPLMIGYIILAVPLTAIGVLILLIPALLFLALAIFTGAVGVNVITAAFGGFSVFADIMVVLGIGFAIVALAVLMLWVFIWFICGAIAGLINGAIRLGGKICCREE